MHKYTEGFFFLNFFGILIQEEHQAIRKSKEGGEPLNWEDYQKMEFTSNVNMYRVKNNLFFLIFIAYSVKLTQASYIHIQVIHEAMRCGNVVKMVHRKAVKDVIFKGFDLCWFHEV